MYINSQVKCLHFFFKKAIFSPETLLLTFKVLESIFKIKFLILKQCQLVYIFGLSICCGHLNSGLDVDV